MLCMFRESQIECGLLMAAYGQSLLVHVELSGGVWGVRMMGVILGPGERPSAETGGGACSYGADSVCVCVCVCAGRQISKVWQGSSWAAPSRGPTGPTALSLEREPGGSCPGLGRQVCPVLCTCPCRQAHRLAWSCSFGSALGALASPTPEPQPAGLPQSVVSAQDGHPLPPPYCPQRPGRAVGG